MSTKYVYLFSEGNGKMKNLLGGKGANLAEMTNLGIPVPAGFTISTEVCRYYYNNGKKYHTGANQTNFFKLQFFLLFRIQIELADIVER